MKHGKKSPKFAPRKKPDYPLEYLIDDWLRSINDPDTWRTAKQILHELRMISDARGLVFGDVETASTLTGRLRAEEEKFADKFKMETSWAYFAEMGKRLKVYRFNIVRVPFVPPSNLQE